MAGSSSGFPYSFGWLPDLPDVRDYTKDTPKVASLLSRVKKPLSLPSTVDLRPFCPPIFDQGNMGSCTANAAAGLLGYHRGRLGHTDTLSRLFIYKCTRDLMMAKGDTGAYIRTTMGSLALFGSPPEKYWDYLPEELDTSPPAFCYSFAANYQATSYFRLDPIGGSSQQNIPLRVSPPIENPKTTLTGTGKKNSITNNPETTLTDIKNTLAGGLPAMFGFTVYSSIRDSVGGKIPFPALNEKIEGGHAVLAVGYDDSLTIQRAAPSVSSNPADLRIGDCTTGAFLIRNSWGAGWGDAGYGWLPYEYLLRGIAQDWWCLVKAEWVETGQFGV